MLKYLQSQVYGGNKMRDQIQNFLNHLSIEKGFSGNTVEAYRNDLYQLADFVNDKASIEGFSPRWSAVDRNVLISYILELKERNYAPATVARKVAAIKSFFDFMVADNILQKDPTEN